MSEPQAVEARVGDVQQEADVRPAIRSLGRWPRRSPRVWRYALLRRMLACADIAAALLASVSLAAVGPGDTGQLAWALFYLPAWIVTAKLLGLYDRDGRSLRHLTVDEAPQIVLWAIIGTSGLALFLERTPAGWPAASSGVVAGVVAAGSMLLLRTITRWLWRVITPSERVAIVGNPAPSAAVKRKLELFPDLHMLIVEERDSNEFRERFDLGWLQSVDRLVFAPVELDDDEILDVLEMSRSTGVALSVVPPCSSVLGSAAQLNHLAELPVLSYAASDLSRSTLFLKRGLDVIVSGLALLVLLPLLALVAVAIKLDSRGPVFFTQLRAGLGGHPFRMLKFRSMVSNAEELLKDLVPFERLDEPVFKLRGDPRVTRFGRVLRRWSLDELPQLWNVLVGHMSLVGPRPEQLDLVARYSGEQRRRLAVKPGLTGPMQVYGRGQLTLSERLAVERDYVENLSIGRDLRLLALTVATVLSGKGAY